MSEIEITVMKKNEINDAARVCSEAFVNTPFTKYVMGGSSEKHRKFLEDGMKRTLSLKHGTVMVAKDNGKIVGAMRMVEWPNCQNVPKGMGYLIPRLMMGKAAVRLRHWKRLVGEYDPQERHCHIDPICITPSHQGKGIGSKLMSVFNDYCDKNGIPGYFETDQEQNVKFYEKNGFKMIKTVQVGPLPNWFLLREN
jgi:ribosomal protein S18 acetylase RimI-like enzyme